METELIKELNGVLKAFPQYWDGEKLHRSMVIDAINQKEPNLIKALISNDKIKSLYSTDIDRILLFDFEKLTSLLKYKEFWNDSFTKYRNTVGLTSEGKYLNYNSDVVLDFPFKDCVLEGGMTKEDQGKDEIYYNEVIARDEIDRLFSPKVLTNTKRYTKNGIEENITDFSDEDNLIIKGNNLIALHSLKERYAGKVKLIYIDPPYNTGNDSFKYNDRFNRSTWLTFMKNRLEIAKELLSDDGVIFISCDDNEQAYLKILADNIFNESNFIQNFIWYTEGHTDNQEDITHVHEYILCYSKNKSLVTINNIVDPNTKEDSKILRDFAENSITKNGDKNPPSYVVLPKGFPCEIDNLALSPSENNSAFIQEAIENKYISRDLTKKYNMSYPVRVNEMTVVNGVLTKDCKVFSGWMNLNKLKNFIDNGCQSIIENDGSSIRFFLSKNGVIYYRREGRKPHYVQSVLRNMGTTETNKYLLENIGVDFSFPKPYQLITYLISLFSTKNSIILDYHAGSGTTGHAVNWLNKEDGGQRKFILIEQLDYAEKITTQRVLKTVKEPSIVYAELMELNYQFIHKIENANNYEALKAIFTEMKDNAHLNYHADLNKVLKASYEMDGMPRLVSFDELELHEQKKLLIELLDKNQLYVSHSEIKDKTLNVSEADQAFNHSFYEKD